MRKANKDTDAVTRVATRSALQSAPISSYTNNEAWLATQGIVAVSYLVEDDFKIEEVE